MEVRVFKAYLSCHSYHFSEMKRWNYPMKFWLHFSRGSIHWFDTDSPPSTLAVRVSIPNCALFEA